jgi:hypothetical protein
VKKYDGNKAKLAHALALLERSAGKRFVAHADDSKRLWRNDNF